MSEEVLIINFLELTAFLFSLFYYKKEGGKTLKILVWFLGFTVFLELLGWYPSLINPDGLLKNLQGSIFEKNFWLYNICMALSAIFYVFFFKWQLNSRTFHRILNMGLVFFGAGSIMNFIFSGMFFISNLPFVLIVGDLLIFLSICFYYLELLKSNQILNVLRSLPFYISVGILIFHLCTTPLFLYSIYFSKSMNPSFVKMYIPIIFTANFILYSIYIAAFIICSRSKKLY